MCRERVNESIANRKAVSKRRFEAPRKLESGFRRLVSRPRGFHLEPLAEPCVNLSIYTAPMTQPFPQRHSSGRTALEMRSSSGAASPHGAACAATVSCTCVWPIAQDTVHSGLVETAVVIPPAAYRRIALLRQFGQCRRCLTMEEPSLGSPSRFFYSLFPIPHSLLLQ